MKTLFRILTILLLLCFTRCSLPDSDYIDPYKPKIMERSVMESSVKMLPSQNIIRSGKIYIKDNFMFINDVNIGFHIYNYSNPENPIKIGFIQTYGATDLAVRDNFIYINQAVDLVTLQYNVNSNTITVSHRNRNVFPQKQSPNGTIANTTENQIVIDWTKF